MPRNLLSEKVFKHFGVAFEVSLRSKCRNEIASKIVFPGDHVHCQKENENETEWSMIGLGAATGNQYVLRVGAEN